MLKLIKDILSNKLQKNMLSLAAPLEGEIVPITEVNDPVFSEKMMGDGFAIIPKLGSIVSPVNGTVESIFPTKHAIGIKSVEGYEIIIHFGLETVSLNGEGFEVLVREGQNISVGDNLLKVDLDGIRKKVPSVITPVVVANLKANEFIKIKKQGQVALGEKNIAVVIG